MGRLKQQAMIFFICLFCLWVEIVRCIGTTGPLFLCSPELTVSREDCSSPMLLDLDHPLAIRFLLRQFFLLGFIHIYIPFVVTNKFNLLELSAGHRDKDLNMKIFFKIILSYTYKVIHSHLGLKLVDHRCVGSVRCN